MVILSERYRVPTIKAVHIKYYWCTVHDLIRRPPRLASEYYVEVPMQIMSPRSTYL